MISLTLYLFGVIKIFMIAPVLTCSVFLTNSLISMTYYSVFFAQSSIYVIINFAILSPLILAFQVLKFTLVNVFQLFFPLLHINKLKDNLKLLLFFCQILQLNIILVMIAAAASIFLLHHWYGLTKTTIQVRINASEEQSNTFVDLETHCNESMNADTYRGIAGQLYQKHAISLSPSTRTDEPFTTSTLTSEDIPASALQAKLSAKFESSDYDTKTRTNFTSRKTYSSVEGDDQSQTQQSSRTNTVATNIFTKRVNSLDSTITEESDSSLVLNK